jgi:hypothetical protein
MVFASEPVIVMDAPQSAVTPHTDGIYHHPAIFFLLLSLPCNAWALEVEAVLHAKTMVWPSVVCSSPTKSIEVLHVVALSLNFRKFVFERIPSAEAIHNLFKPHPVRFRVLLSTTFQ